MALLSSSVFADEWFVPTRAEERTDVSHVKLTQIGAFGILRKSRPGIPSHLHTGIDIQRPYSNYQNEPVFPASFGTVISIRDDGPFAQIIIEHAKLWTVYEHIAGITCTVGENVDPHIPIARFFNTKELNTYGWQFDHFHFEIMKTKPVSVTVSKLHPQRFYATYALSCFNDDILSKCYINPLQYLQQRSETPDRGAKQ